MRKLFLPGIALVVVLASTASAGTPGINLSWNKCDTSPASTNIDYSCHGDLGNLVSLQGSFRSPVGFNDFAGMSAVVDFIFAVPVPNYWMTESGTCNYGAMTISNPSATAPCVTPNIFDPAFSGGGFAVNYPMPNRMRIRIDWATGAPTPPVMAAGSLYPAFKLSFDPDQGVLNGCSGCELPATLGLLSVEVFGFQTGEDYFISVVDAPTITWQSAVPTPARNQTWGAVKALYR
jgi:hypothetical protein